MSKLIFQVKRYRIIAGIVTCILGTAAILNNYIMLAVLSALFLGVLACDEAESNALTYKKQCADYEWFIDHEIWK